MSSQERDTPSGQPTYVRLTHDQRTRLTELAKSDSRTLSGYLRLLVEKHLAEGESSPVLEQAA